MFKPEINLALSALVITGTSQPSAVDVQAQVIGTTDAIVSTQFPQCSAEDNQTEWVIDLGENHNLGGSRYITQKLGNLSKQCGNDPIANPKIGGLTFEAGRFIAPNQNRIFDLDTTKVLPEKQKPLSCPEGFTGFEFVNIDPNSPVELLPSQGQLNQDQTITTRLSIDLSDKSKLVSQWNGSFIQKCIDRLGNSIPFKQVDFSLLTPFLVPPFISNVEFNKLGQRFVERFQKAFGSTDGDPNYDPQLDYDGDKVITIKDHSLFVNPKKVSEQPAPSRTGLPIVDARNGILPPNSLYNVSRNLLDLQNGGFMEVFAIARCGERYEGQMIISPPLIFTKTAIINPIDLTVNTQNLNQDKKFQQEIAIDRIHNTPDGPVGSPVPIFHAYSLEPFRGTFDGVHGVKLFTSAGDSKTGESLIVTVYRFDLNGHGNPRKEALATSNIRVTCP